MNNCFKLVLLFSVFFFMESGSSTTVLAEEWTIALLEQQLHPGDVARVDLSPGEAASSASLSWKGRSIPLRPLAKGNRLTAFFGIPRDEIPGEKEVKIAVTGQDGKVVKSSIPLEILPKDFPVQRLNLPESQVSLDEASLARHHREQKDVKAVFDNLRQESLRQEIFVRPVAGEVSSPFGLQRILNGKPRSPHAGIDLRTPLGQPVAASSDGLVVLADEHFFSGKAVYIDHGMGIVTMYFHLSEIKVQPGDRVTAAQIIGLAGSTGRSTGPHLHWGARVYDCNVDPLALLEVGKTADLREAAD